MYQYCIDSMVYKLSLKPISLSHELAILEWDRG